MRQDLLQSPIKIWYKALPQFRKILWPIIGVKLTYKDNSLPQPALTLIDSGANKSILHPLVAESLGFNLKKLGRPKPGGVSVSGQYESWELPDPIEVGIYGYTFNLKFTVINNQNLIWVCILGGDSIFELARLDFQKFKGYFELRFRSDIS